MTSAQTWWACARTDTLSRTRTARAAWFSREVAVIGSRFKWALVALALCPAAAQADNLIALSDDAHLLAFDSSNPGVITSEIALTGIPANVQILGMDYRSTTQTLVLIGSSINLTALYDVDTHSGAVSQRGASIPRIDTFTNPLGQVKRFLPGEVDIDPSSDTLRVLDNLEITLADPTSFPPNTTITEPFAGSAFHRVDPNSGARLPTDNAIFMSYGSGAGSPATPATIDPCLNSTDQYCLEYRGVSMLGIAHSRVVSSASNAVTTTLYGIQSGSNATLVLIGSLNGSPDPGDSGKLKAIGPLGIALFGTVPFDIVDAKYGYIVTDDPAVSGSTPQYLRSLNLATGAADTPQMIGSTPMNLIAMTVAPNIVLGGAPSGGGGGLGLIELFGLLGLAAVRQGLRKNQKH
jgi:hypothetical protein